MVGTGARTLFLFHTNLCYVSLRMILILLYHPIKFIRILLVRSLMSKKTFRGFHETFLLFRSNSLPPSKNPKIYYTIENKVRNEREITNDNNRRKEQFSSVEILFALSKREMNGRRRKNYLGRI